MELPIYKNIFDFKKNYIIDYSNSISELTFIQYLLKCLDKYSEINKDILSNKYQSEKLCEIEHSLLEKLDPPAFEYLYRRLDENAEFIVNGKRQSEPEDYLSDFKHWFSFSVSDIEILEYIREFIINEEFVKIRFAQYRKNEDIISFLHEKLDDEKNNLLRFQTPPPPQTFETPENDYSGKNELSPKEKLIVLDKLGIVNFLTEKLDYSDNATHLAEILGAITGIDNQKGTLTGYCNYLIRPDDFNKNSPYFSETTVKKANQIYNTFNIKDKTD
ncbi:hypothetical protein [Soonwooa sp.]|uniref:hypothetical protein n=1 Tax=Soonwooa sp. TaxID=1938592 RepID=UPI0028B1006E|nr:hypothetical protein [Soonwooa sp.]